MNFTIFASLSWDLSKKLNLGIKFSRERFVLFMLAREKTGWGSFLRNRRFTSLPEQGDGLELTE